MIQLLSQLHGGSGLLYAVPDVDRSRSDDPEDPLVQLTNTYSEDAEDSRQPDHYQGEAIEPDDHFSPDMDIDLGTSDAMTRAGAYLGMDPNISDSEMDHSGLSGAGSGFVGSDSDSDDEAEAELHPALVPSSIRHPDTSDPSSFSEREPAGVSSDEGDDFGAGADLPKVVRRLRTQLLSGYTPPNHPPIDDPRVAFRHARPGRPEPSANIRRARSRPLRRPRFRDRSVMLTQEFSFQTHRGSRAPLLYIPGLVPRLFFLATPVSRLSWPKM
ncbi:hypothetical protein EDB83DRAFT_2322926 [Lactarius deliciosus]|nr:hypothetical protein EDB83DRAFT_2322926 [Lactarius deliciosus]